MNICALATAKGGAIAIIRVSGPDAISIVEGLVSQPLGEVKGFTLHYRDFIKPTENSKTRDKASTNAAPPSGGLGADGLGACIDDVLISVFRAPHSYTGENSVEISCHASEYIINTILQTLIENGCRQALPGEFTQRAFMNGKMDLSQAEAVADVIASTNAATHRMAMSQLRGNFSSQLAELREKLLHLTTLMELELDFSDHEDLEFADRSELQELSLTIYNHIEKLANSFKTGQALKHGVPVAIVGKTNVGKSTLLNRLLHEEKAIVSDIHGTTRDVIEDTINIKGIDFRFIDTAGLRETEDFVEQIGIKKAIEKFNEAAIVLWLSDEASVFEGDLSSIANNLNINSLEDKKVIKVLNKIDVNGETTDTDDILKISAKENIGIDQLEEALITAADIPEIKENDIIVTSARHYEALVKAQDAIRRVLHGMQTGIPTDLLSEDLRQCLSHLAEITGGEISTNEVLGNIFSHFCVGK